MLDPMERLSEMEARVFGVNAKRHAVLGFIIEEGKGALPVPHQARNYLRTVEQTEGWAAADALRLKLEVYERINQRKM